jgi:Pyruvate/2-oxoglutarate dehydrogenase complex, dihydrolipoamide dehydrogenase (E3) component, and related enzymes
MGDFDVLVIGGGTGNNVAAAAADAGLETALVEPGPLGGTCLNRGCNPSKMLLQTANAANDVRDAAKFHVGATLTGVDHGAVVADMTDTLSGIAADMEERYRDRDHLTLFDEYTRFVGDRAVELGGETVTADRVVIATGSRPLVPPIDGLDETPHTTSRDVFERTSLPDSLVILGGGYIAVELGYYYESVGTDVTIVEMEDRLVPREDDDVAETFTDIAANRHDVVTSHRVTAVEDVDGERRVHAEGPDGNTRTLTGDELLVALGRRPNSDDLGLEHTAVETNQNGFVTTDSRLQTTAENVWAQGDVADKSMFKHTGDYETRHTVANVVHDEGVEIDLTAEPHTIFTEPQIAGVGATETELADRGVDYHVGRADYADSAMGRAKRLREGFAKVLAAPDGEILGCHVVGYEASTLLHEAVVAIRNGVGVDAVADTIHAHPTLSKVVESAFADAASR